MTTQPEAILENNLVKQLSSLCYEKVQILDEVSDHLSKTQACKKCLLQKMFV